MLHFKTSRRKNEHNKPYHSNRYITIYHIFLPNSKNKIIAKIVASSSWSLIWIYNVKLQIPDSYYTVLTNEHLIISIYSFVSGIILDKSLFASAVKAHFQGGGV